MCWRRRPPIGCRSRRRRRGLWSLIMETTTILSALPMERRSPRPPLLSPPLLPWLAPPLLPQQQPLRRGGPQAAAAASVGSFPCPSVAGLCQQPQRIVLLLPPMEPRLSVRWRLRPLLFSPPQQSSGPHQWLTWRGVLPCLTWTQHLLPPPLLAQLLTMMATATEEATAAALSPHQWHAGALPLRRPLWLPRPLLGTQLCGRWMGRAAPAGAVSPSPAGRALQRLGLRRPRAVVVVAEIPRQPKLLSTPRRTR